MKERRGPRSLFGKLVKFIFIAFNILMVLWMFAGVDSATEDYSTLGSDAEKAGAAIGTGLGVMFLLFIWGVGDLILGLMVLFTRGEKIIISREVGEEG